MSTSSTAPVAPSAQPLFTALSQLERASKRIREAEAAGLSQATIDKRWREFFAAEDALEALGGEWA